MSKVKADYCINPNCRQIIKYEEGTQAIRCPGCDHAFLTREFKNEQQKVFEELVAGKQAKAALEMTVKEKDALQDLLNSSQKVWIENVEIQRYIEEKLDVIHLDIKGIHEDTRAIKSDTQQLLGGQTQINEALQRVVGKTDLEWLKAELKESLLQGIREELSHVPIAPLSPAAKEASVLQTDVMPIVMPKSITDSQSTVQPVVIRKSDVRNEPDSDFKIYTHALGCTIERYTGDAEKLVVPEMINGNKVVSIDDNAFCGCSSLIEVQLPSGIRSLGSGAFMKCSSLKNINVPDGVQDIPWRIFHGCSSLTRIMLPNSVTKIRSQAFSDCSSLEEVSIPNGVTTIQEGAFSGCKSLESIELPSALTEIPSRLFAQCSNLRNVKFNDTFSPSVTTIGECAFLECEALTYLNIPFKVERIEKWAFAACKALSRVNIYDGVKHIDKNAFSDCPNLTLYIFGFNSYAIKWAKRYRIPFEA